MSGCSTGECGACPECVGLRRAAEQAARILQDVLPATRTLEQELCGRMQGRLIQTLREMENAAYRCANNGHGKRAGAFVDAAGMLRGALLDIGISKDLVFGTPDKDG